MWFIKKYFAILVIHYMYVKLLSPCLLIGNETEDQNPQDAQLPRDVIVDRDDPADGSVRSRSRRSTETWSKTLQ